MNTRLLLFPALIAGIAALDACEGVSLNDPSIKVCKDDTTTMVIRWPTGQVDTAVVIWHADSAHCRKAA